MYFDNRWIIGLLISTIAITTLFYLANFTFTFIPILFFPFALVWMKSKNDWKSQVHSTP